MQFILDIPPRPPKPKPTCAEKKGFCILRVETCPFDAERTYYSCLSNEVCCVRHVFPPSSRGWQQDENDDINQKDEEENDEDDQETEKSNQEKNYCLANGGKCRQSVVGCRKWEHYLEQKCSGQLEVCCGKPMSRSLRGK